MYYPHRLSVNEITDGEAITFNRLGVIRCYIRVDSGIRVGETSIAVNDNPAIQESQVDWIVITPIESLAIFRLATRVAAITAAENILNSPVNFALQDVLDATGNPIPTPFRRDLNTRSEDTFNRPVITIVDMQIYERTIRMKVRATGGPDLPFMGKPYA